MELTVLGASSRYLSPLGAGVSYLLTHGDTRIVLDCANGTMARLAQETRGAPLSGVLVSHFHVDTVSDLLPVAFSLPPGAPLLVPRACVPRLGDILRSRAPAGGSEPTRLLGVGRGDEHVVGAFTLSFAKGGHGCPGVATRVTADDGRSLVYLADTGPRPWLADFARGCDVLLAHSLLLDRDGASEAARTNLTAGEAGRLARAAGARRLALCHVPLYGNAEESLAEAKAESGGDVVLLREGERLHV